MAGITDPAAYEAWYHTPRGHWIGDCEFNLLQDLLGPRAGETLLDVGCGTGYFTRRFAHLDLTVTGVDPDQKALDYAKRLGGWHSLSANRCIATHLCRQQFRLHHCRDQPLLYR